MEEALRNFFLFVSCWKSRLQSKCVDKDHPPGDEVYRDEEKGISVFCVSGDISEVRFSTVFWLRVMAYDIVFFQVYCSQIARLSLLWLKDKVRTFSNFN